MKNKFFIMTTIPLSLMFFKGQVGVLKKKFDIEIISSSGELLDKFRENEKVKTYPIEMKREIAFFNDLVSLFKLVKLFIKTKPKIVHSSTPKAGLLGMVASWITKVPIRIYYIHGLRYQGAEGIKRKILLTMEKLTCRFATDIFSVSFGVKDILEKDKITSKKINIIGNGSVNGIDTDYFSSDKVTDRLENLNIKKNDFVFGFVGRVVKDKGIEELVDAFKKLEKDFSHIKLLLVGEYEKNSNPLKQSIKDEIKNNPNIITVGFQSEIRAFLKKMDIFILPSYREGFGVSLIEALSMGIPVISTNITGCNEIIQDGINGILITPKSTIELYNTMVKLLVNDESLDNMRKTTRESVKKYAQKEVWENTLKSYLEIEKRIK